MGFGKKSELGNGVGTPLPSGASINRRVLVVNLSSDQTNLAACFSHYLFYNNISIGVETGNRDSIFFKFHVVH